MRHALCAALVWLATAGCISTKTNFRDYSDLGGASFEYIHKSASYTHTTMKGLCLFRSNPYLGAGPMYEGLHKKYNLGPNEAFINQRFDTVNKFYVFFCQRDYTLSADVVRFSHGGARSVVPAHPPHASPVAPPTAVSAAGSAPSGIVTLKAGRSLTVICPGMKQVTGRPTMTNQTATVRFKLTQPLFCTVRIGEEETQVSLFPGDNRYCSDAKRGVFCQPIDAE